MTELSATPPVDISSDARKAAVNELNRLLADGTATQSLEDDATRERIYDLFKVAGGKKGKKVAAMMQHIYEDGGWEEAVPPETARALREGMKKAEAHLQRTEAAQKKLPEAQKKATRAVLANFALLALGALALGAAAAYILTPFAGGLTAGLLLTGLGVGMKTAGNRMIWLGSARNAIKEQRRLNEQIEQAQSRGHEEYRKVHALEKAVADELTRSIEQDEHDIAAPGKSFAAGVTDAPSIKDLANPANRPPSKAAEVRAQAQNASTPQR